MARQILRNGIAPHLVFQINPRPPLGGDIVSGELISEWRMQRNRRPMVLKARARHEEYVGPWLPEPVVDEAFDDTAAGDLAHDVFRRAILAQTQCWCNLTGP